MIKPVSWSHSALKDFEGCKRRYHEVRVLKKYPFEQTDAARYGDEVHKAIEEYVRDGKPLPPEFQQFKAVVDAMCRKPGRKVVEQEMALTPELTPCDWFDKRTWVRGKADIIVLDDDNFTAWVADWKTGSNKYPDEDQLTLMSLLVFEYYPHIRKVNAALLFILKNDLRKKTVTRDQREGLWWEYRERVAKIESAHASGVWNPTQSGLCRRYCPVVTCEHNGNH